MKLHHAFFIVPISVASANTLAKSDMFVYVGLGGHSYSVKDTGGETESELFRYPEIGFQYNIDRINRINTSFRVLEDTDIKAGNGGYGLNAEGYQISAHWQRKFRLYRHFKPWFGAGVTFSDMNYTNRHITDSDGYTIYYLSNLSEENFSMLLSSGVDYDLADNWMASFSVDYEMHISDGLEGFGAGAGLKYRF
ncbi:MAG: outer membrane beta-barrel protein [Pseudomonadales bacterium]|nr:outer membrane beta-barrel protein [Pseudomonadales bacterium]